MFGRGRLFLVILALVVIFTLSTGGLFHAIIPHNHLGGEMLWDGIHGALSHEQKKFFFTLALLLGIGTLFLFALLQRKSALVFAITPRLLIRNPHTLATALKRGTLAYRKFR